MGDNNSYLENSVEYERSPSENVTIIAETFCDGGQGATVSSLKSEDSTEHLICKTPQQKNSYGKNKIDTRTATPVRAIQETNKNQQQKQQVTSVENPSPKNTPLESIRPAPGPKEHESSRFVLLLGLGQLFIGVVMVLFGTLVIVHNASLSRVGAGLWSGCVAIATGMIGVLAGINDCYGPKSLKSGKKNPFLTAFLAMSLGSLAAGNMTAVLAGTGIYRDISGNHLPTEIEGDMEEEKAAWIPVFTNIGLLIIATLHCLLAIVSIYHTSRRVCPCFHPKEPYNHNQFYPNYKNIQSPYVVVNEKPKFVTDNQIIINSDLCKVLEKKLVVSECEAKERRFSEINKEGHGSSNSKEKLVTSWLGRHQNGTAIGKVGKQAPKRKLSAKPQSIVLVPAPHPVSTMSRRMPMVPMQPHYPTLPLMHPPPPRYRGHLYYPPEMIRRRRRSPRNGVNNRPAQQRDSKFTRSLERMHRNKVRDEALTDADVIRTYTGLDRTIAEQFIVACDETRNEAVRPPIDKTDSSGFDTTSSDHHSNHF